jgi:hypothetical protein
MIIEATFTGKNSLGYKTGKEYKLKVVAFLRNWSNIKNIKVVS